MTDHSPAHTKRINILRVITWLPVGGIERRLVSVLPRLNRERFNVRLVCIRERGKLADELEAAGIPVDLIPFEKRWDPKGLYQLARLMREHRIDVVHSHMYRSNVPATVAARLAGVRNVWCQVHNVHTWETTRQVWMDRFLNRWRSGMIAVSERVRQDVIETLQIDPRRVRLIYNGVELERFIEARARREEVRQREGVDEGQRVFLFSARLVEQKRPQDFLEAFGRLQLAPGGDRLRAWILGDGPLKPRLEELAKQLPKPTNVKFFGKRDDVEDFLAAADVFVLPSTKEGFSNALVEAMASGLAIIASRVGGNPEAIRDGRDGLVVPPLDVDRLTEAIGRINEDHELRRGLAQSAMQRAQMFSQDRMIKAIEDLYKENFESQPSAIKTSPAPR